MKMKVQNSKKFKQILCGLLLFMCVCSTSLYAGGNSEGGGGDNGGGSNLTEEQKKDLENYVKEPKVQKQEEKKEVKTFFQKIISAIKSMFSGTQSASGQGKSGITENSEEKIKEAKKEANENTAEEKGDPVLLTSGKYIQTEADIILKTLTSIIPVKRFYISNNTTGGNILGSEWTSNLETRIIRGVSKGFEQGKTELETQLNNLKNERKKLDEEIARTGTSLEKEDADVVAEADQLILKAEAEIAELNAIAKKAENLEKLNKYVLYGKVTRFSSTGNDTLILVVDGYIPVVFEHKGNGSWEAVEKKYKNAFTVKSNNGKDSLEADSFILTAKDGTKKTFNKWGLLSNIIDKNGNVSSFVRDSQQKLTEIKNDNGQSLRFAYNAQNLLEKIELYEGEKSAGQSVTYEYSGKLLSSITDTDGDTQKFLYNSNNNLSKLLKSDGTFVEFVYGLEDKDGNLYTTSTINEEGHAEKFDYDRANKITTYTDHDGVVTVYKYDENHLVTEQKEADGTSVKFAYNDTGKVIAQTVNGSTTRFAYDEKDNLLKVQYADNSSESFVYDANNNCIKVTDRDGIVTEFSYDKNGNCTSVLRGGIEAVRAAYNAKGLVTDIYRNGGEVLSRTSFSYDSKGNVIEKITYTKKAVIKESWTYDEQNRVITYTDGEKQKFTYSYTDKTVTETTAAGLERTYTTNSRKDLVLIEETDTLTGEKRLFAYEYDKRHLVTAVKAGASEKELATVVSYEYSKAGKAISEKRTDDNGSWITEYIYDSAGRIEAVKRSKTDKYDKVFSQPVTQKYSYARTSSGSEFIKLTDEGRRTVVSYDRWNRVTDVKNALDEKSHRSLSSAGRIIKEESSHGGIYTYGYDDSGNLNSLGEQGKKQVNVEYNPDGSTKSVKDRLGNVTTFEYDERGLLIKKKSPESITTYEYDNVGRIKGVFVGSFGELNKNNATQYAEYEYSDAGRSVKIKAGGLYETVYTLNAWGEVVAVTDGVGNTRRYEYDSLGRTKSFIDGYGAKTEYSYNGVGRISSLTAPNGAKKTYEYNELYQVVKAEDGEGVFFEGTYSRDGLLVAEKSRPGVNKEYSYDKLGRIIEVKTGGEVTERYSYTTKGRTITFTDGKGSDYIYNYDEFGRLVSEKNRLDGTQSYTYNENSELKAKKDFEGNMTAVSYDTKTRTKKISYADGTENIIVYDECGNVLNATNESGTLSYIYDKAGFLTKETDEKTGENVNYFYDKAGRRTRLLSKERDISYNYGKNSELLTQKDRAKQLEVSYKYDISGREIERRFGNGVKQLTFYDKAGRIVCIKQVNASDRLLSGESYVYDKTGRRSLTVNEKGLVTVYKYDNQSRLETVFYPFNEDIKETSRKEAEKQGLYFLSTQGNPENYFLSSAEMLQLKAAAERIASGKSGAITVNQIVWKESYTYDPNGNRTSKTTAWGTVAYSYDKENRLVESGELGKIESVKYSYDANGNLLRESAARYRKDYVYNAQNRMAFSDVQDSVANTRNLTEYAYDSFGRRIETRELLGNYTRTLYDGFSFDIIGQSDLTETPLFNVSESVRTRTTPNSSNRTSQSASSGRNERGTEIGTRYRYIDETPLVPFNEATTSASATGATAKTRSRPSNEYVLYAYGEPIAVSADGNTSYFGTDILGSVRNVTDKYGTVQADYSYDAFGSPYLGNLENDIGFGYCGKVYDVGTGLYDYGFRDYSPVSARFTTVDPIRDGSNWFSYVVNDPVNYIDPFGLTPTDVKNYTYQGERNGRRYYTANREATMWGLANDTGTALSDVQGYDGDPHNMPIDTELSIPAPSSETTATESTQTIATPSTAQSQTSTPQPTAPTPVTQNAIYASGKDSQGQVILNNVVGIADAVASSLSASLNSQYINSFTNAYSNIESINCTVLNVQTSIPLPTIETPIIRSRMVKANSFSKTLSRVASRVAWGIAAADAVYLGLTTNDLQAAGKRFVRNGATIIAASVSGGFTTATISIMGGGTTTPIAVVAGWGVGTAVGYGVDKFFENRGW